MHFCHESFMLRRKTMNKFLSKNDVGRQLKAVEFSERKRDENGNVDGKHLNVCC